MIDLASDYLATIQKILIDHVPDCEVRVFGSRVTGNAKKYSDIDLALVGKQALDWSILSALKEAFAQSGLPIMVDIVDWWAISTEFQAIIAEKFIVLPLAAQT